MLTEKIRSAVLSATDTRFERYLLYATGILIFTSGMLAGYLLGSAKKAREVVITAPTAEVSAYLTDAEREDIAAPAAPSAEAGSIGSSKRGTKYYFSDCAELKALKQENLVWFPSEDAAKKAGYSPSACVLKRTQ